MTTEPRPTYHHGNLRAALVEAGLDLTRVGGPSALRLRDVTRRVGVSPNAAYRHFADRDSLLEAVAEDIRRRMAEGMAEQRSAGGARPTSRGRSVTAVGADAVATLRAVGLGYIEFALREPGWFETAFTSASSGLLVDGRPPAAPLPPPVARLVDALDALVDEGVLTAERRRGAEWPCWSAVHGFALLALHGPLRGHPPAAVRTAAGRTVDAIIAGVVG